MARFEFDEDGDWIDTTKPVCGPFEGEQQQYALADESEVHEYCAKLKERLAAAERKSAAVVERLSVHLFTNHGPWRFERWCGDGWSDPTLDQCREYVQQCIAQAREGNRNG